MYLQLGELLQGEKLRTDISRAQQTPSQVGLGERELLRKLVLDAVKCLEGGQRTHKRALVLQAFWWLYVEESRPYGLSLETCALLLEIDQERIREGSFEAVRHNVSRLFVRYRMHQDGRLPFLTYQEAVQVWHTSRWGKKINTQMKG